MLSTGNTVTGSRTLPPNTILRVWICTTNKISTLILCALFVFLFYFLNSVFREWEGRSLKLRDPEFQAGGEKVYLVHLTYIEGFYGYCSLDPPVQ